MLQLCQPVAINKIFRVSNLFSQGFLSGQGYELIAFFLLFKSQKLSEELMQLRKDYADLAAKTSSRLPDAFIDLNYLFYFIYDDSGAHGARG